MENIVLSKLKTTLALIFMMLPIMINPSFAAVSDCDTTYNKCLSWKHKTHKTNDEITSCNNDCLDCINVCPNVHRGKDTECGRIHNTCNK
jgi:hypothetical protein